MRERLRKIDRVLKVQKQLHKAAEWKLAGLRQQAAELKVAQEVLITTLNDDEVLYGLFVDATAKRLQNLAAQATQVEAQEIAQTAVMLEKAMQAKRAEKMASALRAEARRESEKRDLLSLLDAIAARTDASLP